MRVVRALARGRGEQGNVVGKGAVGAHIHRPRPGAQGRPKRSGRQLRLDGTRRTDHAQAKWLALDLPRPLGKPARKARVESFRLPDQGIDLGHQIEPVSYTHLDVYKRQLEQVTID